MPRKALQCIDEAEPQPIPTKRVRLPPRLLEAVTLLETGECRTQKAAAERAGITANWLSTALRKPEVQVFIARKRSENLRWGSLRASRRVVELINSESEHVSFDASKFVLAVEGVRPPDNATAISLTVNIAPGYVLDLSEPARTIEHVSGAEHVRRGE